MKLRARFRHRLLSDQEREKQIEALIHSLSQAALALDLEIEASLTGAKWRPVDFASRSFAQAAASRRENIIKSVEQLKGIAFLESRAAWNVRSFLSQT
jgi:hypothetical protein